MLTANNQFLSLGCYKNTFDPPLKNNEYIVQFHDFFNQTALPGIWKEFSSYKSYLPQQVIINKQTITYDSSFSYQETIENHSSKRITGKLLHHIDYNQWETLVDLLTQSSLEKVVLARHSFFSIEPFFSIQDALNTLHQLKGSLFAFQISPDIVFFGLTPEHLYYRLSGKLQTEAVAGTRKRGQDQQEDQKLALDLLSSEKDLQEFSYVSNFLKKRLFSLTKNVQYTQLGIKKTPNVQHLHQVFCGKLKERINDHDLIKALHPTPAMCGTPQLEAKQWIKKYETFDRGLYASPIGWISKQKSEFIIGIRSCLIKENIVNLFAGLGIVKGSNPLLEWQELNDKLSLMTGLFNGKYSYQ